MSHEIDVNYQRCRVTNIVEKRLSESMYVALRTVSCHFSEGMLTLRGSVPTFYTKQVVLSLVEDLENEGLKRVNDEIDVAYPHG